MGSIITKVGILLIIIYSLMQLLEFYGVGVDVFGSYFMFYIFLFISVYVLHSN